MVAVIRFCIDFWTWNENQYGNGWVDYTRADDDDDNIESWVNLEDDDDDKNPPSLAALLRS